MKTNRTHALQSDPQTREILVAQISVLTEAIERMTRLLWAHPNACHGDYAQLQSLGLASSCLSHASRVLASDKPALDEQLIMLRSLRKRLENLPVVVN